MLQRERQRRGNPSLMAERVIRHFAAEVDVELTGCRGPVAGALGAVTT